MPDQPTHRPSLSEISHLFLSSVRQKQGGSAPPPRRRPPVRKPSVDLTPEEIKQVSRPESGEQCMALPPVSAIIASHLGAGQMDAARLYARHLAGSGKRVGLIAVDASELRIFRFERGEGASGEAAESGCFDSRKIAEAISEMSCDLDCWLLLTENPRATESRALLRQTDSWVLLCGRDHEGIVACYRSLKGLTNLHAVAPKLGLAVLEPSSAAEADAVFHRLANVCRQFLNWPLSSEASVQAVGGVAESAVVCCQVNHDKAQLADTGHWQVISDFLGRAKASAAEEGAETRPALCAAGGEGRAAEESKSEIFDVAQELTMPSDANPGERASGYAEVIDLPGADNSDAGVMGVLMRHWAGEVVETPVRPPMCPEARLAVSRERRLVLIAMSRGTLAEMKGISEAYKWVMENRALLGMALPQFALEAGQLPHLRLVVDQGELDGPVLKGVLSAETVTVHRYRRVKWGPRTGLLLEAA